MKRLFTLSAMALLVQFAFAGYYGNNILNLRMADNSAMKVYIDGQQMSKAIGTVSINNLTPGNHFMQVYRVDRSYGYENLDNAYRGYITITDNTESFVTVLPGINKIKFDRIVALNQRPIRPNPANPTLNLYPQAPVCEQPNIGPGQPIIPAGPTAMCNADFEQLKAALDNAAFESTRLSILKQALPYNYFTTAQVSQLMDQFWFESTKLEVAKLAYDRTLDQNNYYLVNNSFAFGSSVRELGDYIAMR